MDALKIRQFCFIRFTMSVLQYVNRDLVKEIPIFLRNPLNVNRALLFLTFISPRTGQLLLVRKFVEIFPRQGAPPVSTTPVVNLLPVSTTRVAKFSTFFPSAVDTDGKFATGVNDAAGVNDAGGNCHQYQ
jgi:hypothetical protein